MVMKPSLPEIEEIDRKTRNFVQSLYNKIDRSNGIEDKGILFT